MANALGVTVKEKVEGTYKPRPNSALAEDIQAAVCKAPLWTGNPGRSQARVPINELPRDPTQRLF